MSQNHGPTVPPSFIQMVELERGQASQEDLIKPSIRYNHTSTATQNSIANPGALYVIVSRSPSRRSVHRNIAASFPLRPPPSFFLLSTSKLGALQLPTLLLAWLSSPAVLYNFLPGCGSSRVVTS